ncbi:uncharacterized protein TNCV_4984211 [Trichonephila clavipes]|nr:uncharacterized protein TNCV_4984211 [Trichonephila clavipes]
MLSRSGFRLDIRMDWNFIFTISKSTYVAFCALLVEWLRQQTNCRIWKEANPQVYVETPLHPEKLTVWCALWAGGIIGPYFFKNDDGHNVTVNGDRYRAMITNFFIPELNNHDVQELWFQQDGATCHSARATIDLLKDTFSDRLISRFGPGYVKSLVYADKPQPLDHLEDNIRRVIADIRPQMLEKVIENWTSRFDYIRASRGSCPIISYEEFVAIHDDNVYTAPIIRGKDILEYVRSSKSIIDADSDGENASPVLMSSEMRNIMKKENDARLICRELKRPPVGVVWLLGEGAASSGVILVT